MFTARYELGLQNRYNFVLEGLMTLILNIVFKVTHFISVDLPKKGKFSQPQTSNHFTVCQVNMTAYKNYVLVSKGKIHRFTRWSIVTTISFVPGKHCRCYWCGRVRVNNTDWAPSTVHKYDNCKQCSRRSTCPEDTTLETYVVCLDGCKAEKTLK